MSSVESASYEIENNPPLVTGVEGTSEQEKKELEQKRMEMTQEASKVTQQESMTSAKEAEVQLDKVINEKESTTTTQQTKGKDKKSTPLDSKKEANNTKGQKLGFLEGINKLLDSSLFNELGAAFFKAMSIFAKKEDREKYALESLFLEAKHKLAKGTLVSGKQQILQNRYGERMTYLQALSFLMRGKNEDALTDFKYRFTQASLDQQKKFISEAILKDSPRTEFNAESLRILGSSSEKKPNSSTVSVSGLDTTHPQQTTSLELKGSPEHPYVKVAPDMLVPLVNNKAQIYQRSKDGKSLQEKTITFSKSDQGIISASVDQGSSYAADTKGVVIDPKTSDLTKNAQHFDVWRSVVMQQLTKNLTLVPSDKLEQAEALLTQGMYSLAQLPSDQRTPQLLQQHLQDLKNNLIPYIREDKRSGVQQQALDLVIKSA